DFTYEDEFWAGNSQSTTWPVPPELERSDVLGPQSLQLLRVPLLLMHGSKDNVCPISNSKVLFNVLDNQRRSSPSAPRDLQFVIFSGEGHGFRGSSRAEADSRQIRWLQRGGRWSVDADSDFKLACLFLLRYESSDIMFLCCRGG
ncbi:diacylglycerol pyrophosphate phosphatase, partial [Perkinsus olseni]